MHELGNVPYWIIFELYFPVVSSIYMLIFVIFGALIVKNASQLLFLLNFYYVVKM